MKNKIIIFSLLILFVFSCFLVDENRKITTVEKSIKDLIIFPLRIFSRNVTLEISSEVTNIFNSEANRDLNELKDVLDLNIVNTSVSYINATIINRSAVNYFDVITIDKGAYSGIKEGMSVITKDGFIGEVQMVSNTTSEIKLICSNTFNKKISVTINEQYGIISDYDSKKNVLIVDGIKNINDVKVGDKVLTSGLTSLYPKGILMGEIVGKRKDKFKNLKYLEVKSLVDMNKTHYVSVIKK